MLRRVEHEKDFITSWPVWILFSWLHKMPVDLDQRFFQETVSKFEKDMPTVGFSGRIW